jgi:hypothetical protein
MPKNRSRVNRGVPTGGQFKTERKSAVVEPVVEGGFTLEIDETGTQRWRDSDGDLGRKDGPAVIYPNGISEWWRYDSGCYAVDVPEAQSQEFLELANKIKDEIWSSDEYDSEIAIGVSLSDAHIEASVQYYTKDDYNSATLITNSIRIERRDIFHITEELGGDTFTVTYLVYKDGELSPMDCTELSDSDVGPLQSYGDIRTYVNEFIELAQGDIRTQVDEGTAFLEDPEDDPWFCAGFSDDDKETWSQKFQPDDAREWIGMGFDYDSAAVWCVNFDPDEADLYRSNGISELQATDWKDNGFDAEDALELISKGYSTADEALADE